MPTASQPTTTTAAAAAAQPGRPARTIAFVSNGWEGYGPGRGFLALAASLNEHGQRTPVIVLDEQGPFLPQLREAGFDPILLRAGRPPATPGGPLAKLAGLRRISAYTKRTAPALTDALRACRADAVHIRWPQLVPVVGAAARPLGLPVLWHMPNPVGDTLPFGLNRALYHRTCRRYGVVPLANSEYTKSTIGPGPVTPRVFYVPVDHRRFDPHRVPAIPRDRFGAGPEDVVLIIVARLVPAKGQALALSAMLEVERATGQRLHLVLLGGPDDGPFAAELREAARAAGAEDRLHLIGKVDDPTPWYLAADITMNVYVGSETFGQSVVESLLLERPALVHAAGGPVETVRDGATGWHVSPCTPEQIAAGLRRALAERARWPEMGRAAREDALARFTIDALTPRYLDIVEDVLATSAPRAPGDPTAP